MSNKRIVVQQVIINTPQNYIPYEIDYNYVEKHYLSTYEESLQSFEKLGIKDYGSELNNF